MIDSWRPSQHDKLTNRCHPDDAHNIAQEFEVGLSPKHRFHRRGLGI